MFICTAGSEIKTGQRLMHLQQRRRSLMLHIHPVAIVTVKVLG